MDRSKSSSSVDIQKVLLDMREYRMGLIQTSDQLRFSYMSIIQGAKLILTYSSAEQVWSGAVANLELLASWVVSSSFTQKHMRNVLVL